ncbi:MAG: JAB N-terminal domain-containing protein [Capsulimonadaceae bacterium]
MAIEIELYSGPEQQIFERIEFMRIVKQSLERLLRRSMIEADPFITFLGVPDYSGVAGLPAVENGTPEFGYCYVQVIEGGAVVYKHPHPVHEIITKTLQGVLRDKYPEETSWTFRVDIPGIPPIRRVRPAPVVEGRTTVQPYGPGEKAPFSIRRIEEEAPPVRTLADYGLTVDADTVDAPVVVLVHDDLNEDLLERRTLSKEFEEGGFLIGRTYINGDRPGGYLLELTAAPPAEYTGASFLHFTFTGDSFAEVKRVLARDRTGERLLGWYHTHLFAATPDFGLSSVDYDLHFLTFTIPWQVAGLINIDGTKRVQRYYVRDGAEMRECPWRTIGNATADPDTTDATPDIGEETA